MFIFALLMQNEKKHSERFSLQGIIILALLFMMIGTGLELYLLDHYEDTLQLIPLLCLGTSLILVCILFFRRNTLLFGLFQILMILNAISGLLGVFLHLRANYEFEEEMKPTARSWDLFVESLSGAMPTLAPASMIVLALIGYSYLILLKQK